MQVPPNSPEGLDAISLIGGVMTCDGPIPPIVADVRPEYWQDSRNATIWATILEMLEERTTPTFEAVIHRLVEDGTAFDCVTPYVCALAEDCPTSANIEHWAKLLIANGSKRCMGERLAELQSEGLTAEEMAVRAESIVRQEASTKRHDGPRAMSTILGDLLKELEQERADPEGQRFAASGLRELDEHVTLRAQELSIIAGRPGMGKSALAGNIAAYCARDASKGVVVMFSLEMSAIQVVKRIIAGGMRADTRTLATRVGDEALTAQFCRAHGMAMVIDDRPGLSVAEIDAALRKLTTPVRLVIVDYLQLAGLDADIERQDLRIGAVTKGLKQLAKRHNCHVIALSQLNRGVESRSPPIPSMSDLRDSGAIEEDADTIMLLYREGYYAKSDSTGIDKEAAQIIVPKQRNGEQGLKIEVRWDAKSQRFHDGSYA